MHWVTVVGAILLWVSPPTAAQRTTQEHSYKINPKPCSVNDVDGTCMFVWECIKTEGHHIGMCVDNFMFGSCCVHNVTDNLLLPSSSSQPAVLFSPPGSATSLRPVPSQKPSGSVTTITKLKPSASVRPPSSPTLLFPVTSNNDNFITKPSGAVSSTHSVSKPSSTNGVESHRPTSNINNDLITIRPSTTISNVNVVTLRPITVSSNHFLSVKPSNNYSNFLTSKPSSSSFSGSFVPFRPTGIVSNNNFVAKPTENVPNSGIVTFRPDILHFNSDFATSRPGSSSSNSDFVTFEPASVSSNNNFVTFRPTMSGFNEFYTFRPSLAGSSSGDFVTLKTSSASSNNDFVTIRPSGSSSNNFVTFRPEIGASSASGGDFATIRPFGGTMTELDTSDGDNAASGSTFVSSWVQLQTSPGSSWQMTTEPTFITRPRPPGSGSFRPPRPPPRPKPPTRPTRPTTTTSTTTTTTTPPTTTTTRRTTTSTTTTTTTTTTPSTTHVTPSTAALPDTSTFAIVAASSERGAECGVPPMFPRPEMRIVGGKNSPFGGWPWQVSVRRTSFFGFSSTHRCGGALLNENWIATAGHCVDDLLTSQIRIRVGEYDFSSVQEPYPYVERGVSRKVVHPKYNFFTYEYDLALVKLESPLEFQPHIAPICLPATDDLLIGENATVTGWGRLSEGGTLPSILQQVSVPIVSNDKCKNMFMRAGRHEFIPEIFLCAGYENGGQDSCQGDSGGPLQVKGKNGRYFLAGIISWGIGCAEANLPGVCTRISKFVPWILEHVT